MHAHSFRRPDGNGSYLDCEVPHFRYPIASRILGSDTICMFDADSTLGHRDPRPFGIDERPFWECEVFVHSSLQCRYAGFFLYDKKSYQQSSYLYLP